MIKARNYGIVLAKKETKECMIIDITVPEKARVKIMQMRRLTSTVESGREAAVVRCLVVPVVQWCSTCVPKDTVSLCILFWCLFVMYQFSHGKCAMNNINCALHLLLHYGDTSSL